MITDNLKFINTSNTFSDNYTPLFFRLNQTEDRNIFNDFFSKIAHPVTVYDQIDIQLQELIKIKSPSEKKTKKQIQEAVKTHLNHTIKEEYGVWVYYPWSNILVHILDEEEFIELRTNRNLYKITREERDKLAQKKIGVVGMSVGQSIAIALAMERGCGELRLADFDHLELSNLNRIKTGIENLGISKAVIAAREIARLDPFIKVNCYLDGITEDNIEDFLLSGGKIDLLIEECDSLDIKIL